MKEIKSMNIIEIADALASSPEGFKSKEKYLKRAFYFVDSYEDEDEIYATLLNNIGEIYFHQAQYSKSLKYLDHSLQIRIKLFGENNFILFSNYYYLGMTYMYLKQFQEGIKFVHKAKVLNEKKLATYQGNPLLTKIQIKNFKLLKIFEIEFSPNVNIIIGENSSGKTSLLQAITLGFLERGYSVGEGSEPYLKYITKDEEESILDLSLSFHFALDGKDKVDKNTTKVTLVRNKRTVDKYFYPFILAYGSNIFINYDNKLSYIIEKLLAQKINDGFVSSIFEEYSSGFYNPKSILNELYDKKTEEAKAIIATFIEIIEKFQDTFKLVLVNNKYAFQDKNKMIFKLEDLSEGYRNNILLVTDIVLKILGTGEFPKSVKGIILIDEFDKHLHPKWQSNLISTLRDTFPYIQFIMTTHNPMSILDREADEITTLKEIDGELKAVKNIGTKNIDVGTILLKYFGVDSLVGDEMQYKIKELTDLKLQGDLNEKEYEKLEELEEYFEYTPATNFIYNRAYFNFLIFLKNNENIDFRDYEKMKDKDMVLLMEKFKDLF